MLKGDKNMLNGKIKILAFAGSTRKESYNKKLLRIAIRGAKEAGAEVVFVDLKDYKMPLYDADYEEERGLPDKAIELKQIMKDCQGFLIASPEYNSGYSAVLKNTIDWTSRVSRRGEKPLSVYSGKIASIMSTSPSPLGGLRGLLQLRDLLMNINVMVIPNMKAVGNAAQGFDRNGDLKDRELEKIIKNLGRQLVDAIRSDEKKGGGNEG